MAARIGAHQLRTGIAVSNRRGRPSKPLQPEELANILAYAELHSDKDAADKFRVSVRTLQRYRVELRAGKHPFLAALVAKKKRETTRRCEDLLVSVYEQGLAALARRLEDTDQTTRLKDRDLIGAVHILGNQLVTRDVLNPDEQPADSDSPGSTATAAGAGRPGAPAGGGTAALH